MDYKDTLNLPETDFSMRANLSEREPDFQEFWKEKEVYEKAQEQRKGAEKFILHDGPPYANGDIHIGHALNKTLKDIVTRYNHLKGYQSPYIPGWDTHGLPIEHKVTKDLSEEERKELSTKELREECEEYALKYVERQKEQFKRLGVWGDWDNPYITLEPEYEAKQIEVFGEMALEGLFYQGLKPVHWCTSCETALAEAEIEYEEINGPSIYVKFPVKDGAELGGVELSDEDYVVIWTTTPWTIPSNLAITVHPDFEYVIAEADGDKIVVAKKLLEEVAKTCDIEEYQVLSEFKGEDLEGVVCNHPFFERESPIILGEHVTLESGTGCVHTAPGHGHEDYVVGQEYGLDVYAPMDDKGYFTEEAGEDFAGKHYDKANIKVTDLLKEDDLLMDLSFVDHSYPHCWRCKNPVIFRATKQWFASVDEIKDDALEAIKNVDWYPEWGEGRIENMVADRNDWCISRQRVWGVPIPIFYCEDCGEPLITEESLNSVQELFAKKGSGSWYELDADDILPADIKCEACGHDKFAKETDIMDVWFDSGASHASVLENYDELTRPADLYLEGTDQYRGWFNSSLLTSIAARDEAPYKAVVTNGFTVDEKGKKMSKSVGNVISPHEIIDQYGADILRLWVASSNFKEDVRVSDKILQENAEVYRRIRNTSRFILGNLADFNPAEDSMDFEDLTELDRWALMKLQKVVEVANEAYEDYEYHRVYHAVHNFFRVEMSSFYMDVIKDRLYVLEPTNEVRRSGQTALYEILVTLTKVMAPILVHTTEEIWQELPGEQSESVFLSEWPELKADYFDEELEDKWAKLREIRKDVSKSLEIARNNELIGHSLDAEIELYPNEDVYKFLTNFDDLAELFIVSKANLHEPDATAEEDVYQGEETAIKVKVKHAPGEKCERCWHYSPTVGEDEENPEICASCSDILAKL
ncbi:isoleucine--tRNA ligase [Halanaerobacter jeridensis]|uniref:Isoleucine--tRNA ligase n=1 Tax=Halanaerobacter jeridensis TaxID=706427 RepID=A0A939BPQ8_9FIRM|nr:isoleucine--tRNA ligase [Halanaerobacter jeridensis]MBM7555474.1 isoleucyl-tRNA synthetase [Halanaerobacter jeridensis]